MYTGEKPLGARTKTNNKLNPHMTPSPGIEAGPHWWEASALTFKEQRRMGGSISCFFLSFFKYYKCLLSCFQSIEDHPNLDLFFTEFFQS